MKTLSKNVLIVLFLFAGQLKAQLNPLAAQYFQNPYLANPAMAGVQQGLNINFAYRKQWNIPGSPQNTSISADFNNQSKVGLGVHFYKDQAGLLERTKVAATYAYHLMLNDEQEIHFGLSLGLQKERLNTSALIGSDDDQLAYQFNERESILDGDFGIAYTGNKLTVEASLNNLKRQLMNEEQNTANYSTFYTAVGYKLDFKNWQLNPKIAYRGVRSFEDMFDMALEVKTQDEQLSFTSMYHSNKSFSFGLSYLYQKQWRLLALYNTPTKAIRSDISGSFELGLQLKLFGPEENRKEGIN